MLGAGMRATQLRVTVTNNPWALIPALNIQGRGNVMGRYRAVTFCPTNIYYILNHIL